MREGRATVALIWARAEIQELSCIPFEVLSLATNSTHLSTDDAVVEFKGLLDAARTGDFDPKTVASRLTSWRLALEQTYPNLLSPEDVQRRERILLKLLRLVPKEYQAGVRDGEIVVPLEYRHAKRFTIQSEQIVNELMAVWRNTKAEALERHGSRLFDALMASRRPLIRNYRWESRGCR